MPGQGIQYNLNGGKSLLKWKSLMPDKEIWTRIGKLQSLIKNNNVHSALISQRIDLLYFTGTAQNGYLYVPSSGQPLLMVKKYYPRARAESPIHRVVELPSIKQLPEIIARHYANTPRLMGLAMDVIPFREVEFLKRLFPEQEMVDISSLIHEIRGSKSEWEIQQMVNVAAKSSKCFDLAIEHCSPEANPVKLASTIQTYARRQGHGAKLRLRYHNEKALPFEINIISRSGSRASLIPIDCVVEMDFKWMMNGYHIHETRLLLLGNPPEQLVNACHSVADIHDLIVQRAVVGKPANQLYREIKELAKQRGYGDSLFGSDARGRPWAPGPLGHGIGMELREPPFINEQDQTILTPNMTLAIRPVLSLRSKQSVSMGSVIRIAENGNELISKVPAKIFNKSH